MGEEREYPFRRFAAALTRVTDVAHTVVRAAQPAVRHTI